MQREKVWIEVPDEKLQHTTYYRHAYVTKQDAARIGQTEEKHEQQLARVWWTNKDDTDYEDIQLDRIFRANDDHVVEKADDLTSLTFLEEPNLLHAIQWRFGIDRIYTSIAGIMVAVNPYTPLPIYSKQAMLQVHGSTRNSPHIYSVSEVAFSLLTRPFNHRFRDAPQNQSLIACGESGSGKTENAKHVMRYLANRSGTEELSSHNDEKEVGRAHIEIQIMNTNSILEAFGNAQTLLNHNSSRFGKFTKMYFKTRNMFGDGNDRVTGASIETYLLETSRVVLQSKGERNFHSFYLLFEGLNPEQRKDFGLENMTARDFKYIAGGYNPDISELDSQRFNEMIEGMESLNFSQDIITYILRILAGILYLGNVVLVDDDTALGDGCKISQKSLVHLEKASELLGLTTDVLELMIRTQLVKAGREYVRKEFKPQDGMYRRDALAKTFYERLFLWNVSSLNAALEQDMSLPWIAILDVFGFEIFEHNSFEQFCINFANEMLQTHFNQSILISEQQEYARESIFWEPLEVPDGSEMISLVQQRGGIFALLNETCQLNNPPEMLYELIWKNHIDNPLLEKPARKQTRDSGKSVITFMLCHYAGQVEYTLDDFVAKNRNRADPNIVDTVVNESTNFVLKEAFIAAQEEDDSSRRGGNLTVCKVFSKQLKELLKTLRETQSHFIRCIKPNLVARSGIFDHLHVRPQLKCGGLVEAVKILKCGFPTRVKYQDLYDQFKTLVSNDRVLSVNKRHLCLAILSIFGFSGHNFKLGLTKIFFKAENRSLLHEILNYDKKLTAEQMQILIGYLARKRLKAAISVVRCSSIFWLPIRRQRAVKKLFNFTNMTVIVRRKAKAIKWKSYKKYAVNFQSAFNAILESDNMKLRIEEERRRIEEERRREEERLERLRLQAEEAERRRIEAEEAARLREIEIVERRRQRIEREAAEKERRENERIELHRRQQQEEREREERERREREQMAREKAEEERRLREEHEQSLAAQQLLLQQAALEAQLVKEKLSSHVSQMEAKENEILLIKQELKKRTEENMRLQLELEKGSLLLDTEKTRNATLTGNIQALEEKSTSLLNKAEKNECALEEKNRLIQQLENEIRDWDYKMKMKELEIKEMSFKKEETKEIRSDELERICLTAYSLFEAEKQPSELELQLSDWIEDFMEIRLSSDLIQDLDDGTLLVRIITKMAPRLRLTCENPVNNNAIYLNFQKCMEVARAAGMNEDILISHEDLYRNEEKVFKFLKAIKEAYERKKQSIQQRSFSRSTEFSVHESPELLTHHCKKLEAENKLLRESVEQSLNKIKRLEMLVANLDALNKSIVGDLSAELEKQNTEMIRQKADYVTESISDLHNTQAVVTANRTRSRRNEFTASRNLIRHNSMNRRSGSDEQNCIVM